LYDNRPEPAIVSAFSSGIGPHRHPKTTVSASALDQGVSRTGLAFHPGQTRLSPGRRRLSGLSDFEDQIEDLLPVSTSARCQKNVRQANRAGG
jgi:hypothetical protein